MQIFNELERRIKSVDKKESQGVRGDTEEENNEESL